MSEDFVIFALGILLGVCAGLLWASRIIQQQREDDLARRIALARTIGQPGTGQTRPDGSEFIDEGN